MSQRHADTSEARVLRLGYVGLTTMSSPAWVEFGTEVLGMALSAGEPPHGQTWLRMDDRRYRFILSEGDPGVSFLGFEVSDPAAFDRLRDRLATVGVSTAEEPDTAVAREVAGLFSCTGPEGLRIEVTHGPARTHVPFVSPRGVRFVTGAGGLGHAVFGVGDIDTATDFYCDGLGLGMSDTIRTGQLTLRFLHCGPRHHSIALAHAPGNAGLRHLMVEVDEIDDVGRTYDLVRARDVPVSVTLGRHTNDAMLSFYCVTPDDHEVEYGAEGVLVDPDAHDPTSYDAISSWGHRRLRPPPGVGR